MACNILFYFMDIQKNVGKNAKCGQSETNFLYIYLCDANSVSFHSNTVLNAS